MGRYIRVNAENKVIAERNGSSILAGEIESTVGHLGQIRQGDGTFITPEPEVVVPQPTQLDRIEALLTEVLNTVRVV